MLLAAAAGILFGCASIQPKPAYPTTRTTNQVDVYHGVAVPDPYRWLEDDNSPETKAWVEAENQVTFAWLAKIPQRDAIKQRLTKLWKRSSATAASISGPATTKTSTAGIRPSFRP